MKHRVSELEGALLDAAVAKANRDGLFVRLRWPQRPFFVRGRPYSSEWEQGGPIIEREKISLVPNFIGSGKWLAECMGCPPGDEDAVWRGMGDTPLIAAMRAFVASRMGEEVEL